MLAALPCAKIRFLDIAEALKNFADPFELSSGVKFVNANDMNNAEEKI